jgi:hypothetical protein
MAQAPVKPTELRVLQLAQRVGAAGMQASKAYNDAQVSLDLHLVLTPVRLATTEGTSESLAALARLSNLTSAHKEMFSKFVAMAMEHFTAALAELTEDRAAEYRDGAAFSVNSSLKAQGEFYKNREAWIAAAVGICNLVESRRESITFMEDGLRFSDNDALEAFERLVAEADRIHSLEVAATNERLVRLARSMAIVSATKW